MIHHVFANKSNIGDWLSAIGIQKLLDDENITEYFCDEPFAPDTIERLTRINKGELVVIGGGGLFMDYFEPFWEAFSKIAGQLRYCIWGVGCCDLKNEVSLMNPALLKDVVWKSRLCVVRDQLSRDFLSELALPDPVPCPSISALEFSDTVAFGVLHVDNYTTAGAAVSETMDAYAREFADQTQRPYRKTNNRIAAGDRAAMMEILEWYKLSDIVISSGLHGCMIASAFQCKIICVSGDHKLEAFMGAAGFDDWICDVEDVGKMLEMLRHIDQQSNCRIFLNRVREQQRGIAGEVLAIMKNKT